MSIHPMAAAHARALPAYEALTIALLPDASGLSIGMSGSEYGDADAQALYDACRAMTYTCKSCGESKAVGEYTRDSHGVDLCEVCFDEAGLENAHADGYHDGAADPDCPACREEAA